MSALPLAVHDPRLLVTIATRGDRLETVLRAYLAGPGREVFAIGDASSAQAMIADHDHPASRAAMLRFVHRTGHPVIALATRDPGLTGVVWVPKPVHFEALAAAADRVWTMLSTPASVRPVALQLLPPLPRPAADTAPLAAHPRFLQGPYRTSGRDDWTGKIIWMACGALGIAALASMLGWQPGVQGWRPSSGELQPPAIDTRELERAVRAAWADVPGVGAAARSRSVSVPTSALVPVQPRQPGVSPAGPDIEPSDVLMPSRRALPLALMADAPAATAAVGRAERRAFEAAVRRSVAWWSLQARD